MTATTVDFAAMFDQRLSQVCTQKVVEDAESAWPEAFWTSLERDGFTSIGVAEDGGGSGGDIADACAVLRAVGRNSAPGPWAEAGLLAGFLTRNLQDVLPAGLTTAAPHIVRGTAHGPGSVLLEGEVRRVPWARAADHVLVVVDTGDLNGLVVLERSAVQVVEAENFAGEPRDTVRFGEPATFAIVALDPGRAEMFAPLGGLTRAALVSGAAARIVDLTATYTQQRHQFGRPIAKFQLVQRHLAVLAEQAALVTGAVDAAAAAAQAGRGVPEMVAAKIIANAAASEVAKAAHQAHGAIGVTREYRLHQFTRRLWSWRGEYGSSGEWEAWLGRRVREAGPDALYPAITDPSAYLS
jgi:acyl-CoA dehydrogenase